MTVAQLIEWLKAQDQEAIVQVIDHDKNGGDSWQSQGGTAQIVEFLTESIKYTALWEYTDFRNNKYITPERQCYNNRYLLLGRSE